MGILLLGILNISSLLIRILPVVGDISRVINLRRVDLPAPEEPTINTNSPLSILSEMLSRAKWPEGYFLVTDSNCIMGQRYRYYWITSTLPTSINQPTCEDPKVSPNTLTFLLTYSSKSRTEEVK